MVNKIAVLYKGALAYYEIQKNLLGSYTATLTGYEGDPGSGQPPSVIILHLHDDSWMGHPGDQKLMKDIGQKILK